LHPTQIAAWKREAIEKLAKVFDDKGVEVQANRDAETKLQAKIGQLVVERDFFWPKPSIAESGSEEGNDRTRSSTALDCAPANWRRSAARHSSASRRWRVKQRSD
jgi:hypothetical protein